MKQFIKNKIVQFLGLATHSKQSCIRVMPTKLPVRGLALMSYIHDAATIADDDLRLLGHSNWWESREIVRIFNDFGYAVDCIDHADTRFIPRESYDVVFDIANNMQRVAPLLQPTTKKILHLTGGYWRYAIAAELARVAAAEERTGKLYSPKRLVLYPELAERSLRLADHCTLIGNEHTKHTYPQYAQDKITLVPVSGSYLGHNTLLKPAQGKDFLAFIGYGAVHKGLDRILEVFKNMPSQRVHIVGGHTSEFDFVAMYQRELYETPNIIMHGYLYPSSQQFADIVRQCCAFIAPSCSEGTSPAAVTCMQAGLLPIVSHDIGITLPAGAGHYLATCSIEEIAAVVKNVATMPIALRQEQAVQAQRYAQHVFSREQFSQVMRSTLGIFLAD